MRLTVDRVSIPVWCAVASGAVFVAIAVLVVVRPRLGLDVAVTEWLGSRQQPSVVAVMDLVRLALSQLPLVLTPGIAAILWRWRAAKDGVLLLAAVASMFVLSVALKLIIARPRPEPALLSIATGESDWSFPSSSVAIAVVFWSLLLVVFPRHRHHALVATYVLAIASIGVSRVYVGEHWLSDVIASYLLGAAVVAISVNLWLRTHGNTRRLGTTPMDSGDAKPRQASSTINELR